MDIQELTSRLVGLEAREEIRRVMARYLELCDHLSADTPIEELRALFTRDAVWTGKGERYSSAFGDNRGRGAIAAMLERYCTPVPHFAMNAHFLCSETISVDGTAARGRWMMLQTSTYADGHSDLRASRIDVGFVVEEGRWRIAHFVTENVFTRPVDRWDDPAPLPVPDERGD